MTKSKALEKSLMPISELADAVAAGGERKTSAVASFFAAMQEADTGNRDALKYALAARTAMPDMVCKTLTLQDNAERSILDAVIPKEQLYSRKLVEEQMATLRRDLAGDDPTPLESMLVHRITLCWLESLAADLVLSAKMAGECSISLAEFYQRRADRSQRKFERAVQTYATVRRLLAPVLQVNVAEQQVNVSR